jgi:hypothetical protein
LLQSEGAALSVAAAAGRAMLGNDEIVFSGNRRIRTYDSLQSQEIPVRLRTNHTFYSGWERHRHLDRSVYLEPSPLGSAVMYCRLQYKLNLVVF